MKNLKLSPQAIIGIIVFTVVIAWVCISLLNSVPKNDKHETGLILVIPALTSDSVEVKYEIRYTMEKRKKINPNEDQWDVDKFVKRIRKETRDRTLEDHIRNHDGVKSRIMLNSYMCDMIIHSHTFTYDD